MRWIIVPLFVVGSAFAQTQNRSNVADDQWAGVVQSVKTLYPSSSGAAVGISSDAGASSNARSTAAAAKSFYTINPTHPKAAEARKIEALASLLGVTGSGEATAAKAVAEAYRRDTKNSAADRFEVALQAERVDGKLRLGRREFERSSGESERIADRLKQEFGPIPQVFDLYMTVARSADMATTRRIASTIAQSEARPEAKAEARSMLERDALVGKPLPWNLTKIDKEPLSLAKLSGRTLIYAFSLVSERNALASIEDLQEAVPAGVSIVYFVLDPIPPEKRAELLDRCKGGVLCVEERGVIGPTAERFQLRQTPYVFLIDASARLSAYGPADQVSALYRTAR